MLISTHYERARGLQAQSYLVEMIEIAEYGVPRLRRRGMGNRLLLQEMPYRGTGAAPPPPHFFACKTGGLYSAIFRSTSPVDCLQC
jgi:hypothetical protein